MPELIHHHAEIIVQHRMAVMPCVVCGVLFGVSKEILDARVHYGGNLTCVNGHVMTWPGTHHKPTIGESEAQREARRRVAREIHEQDQAAAKAAEHVATPDAPVFTCPDCGKVYRQAARYGRHVRLVHNKEPA